MWNLKNDTNEFIYKTETYKLREQTYDYQEEWRERREIDWEFRIDIYMGFLGGVSDKEPACHMRDLKRLWFDPWVMKIPWRRVQQPTPVFLHGESLGQRSLSGYGP